MKRIFVFLFIFLWTFSCTNLNDNPLNPPPSPRLNSKLTLAMDSIPQNVSIVKGFLARAQFDTIFFDFLKQGNKAEANVSEIPPGEWYLQVDAFDEKGNLLYSGNTYVSVEAGKVNPVHLHLNPVTGSLIIIVDWSDESSQHPILAYFPFEGNTDDLSPFHNRCQRFGRTGFSAGIKGLALEFDGETGYVQIPHLDVYNKDTYSIAFWFYKSDSSIENTPGWDDVEGLVFKAFNTSKLRDFSFLIGNQQPPFHFNFSTYRDGDSLNFIKIYQVILPRTWYHIAGVVNENRMLLFINGKLVQEKALDGQPYHSQAPIVLGAVPPVDRMIHRYFKGKIDEFAIFDGALSQRDIKKIILNGIK